MAHDILFVEDEEFVRALIVTTLEHEGYNVTAAGTGQEMFELLDAAQFDLVILDLGLPDEDGLVLARKLRARSSVPLIILTAREDLDVRLAGLEIGADDYLTKSVAPEELLLRIRNLLSRSTGGGPVHDLKDRSRVIRFCGWALDVEGYSLTSPSGEEVGMTPSELKLLFALAQNAGRVMTRNMLLDAVSGHDEAPSDRIIDALVSRVRGKIETNPKKPEIITTISGVGYKLNAGAIEQS